MDKKNALRRSRTGVWLTLVLVLGGLGYLFARRASTVKKLTSAAPVPTVQVVRPSVRDLMVRLPYPAELEPIQAAEIRPLEAKGVIRRITVDKGDKVRRGMLLVKVECPEYQERLGQARQAVRASKARLKNAERVYWRLLPMSAKRYVAPLEIDKAKASYEIALATVRNDEARLEEVSALVRYCDIRSPFNGEVMIRHVDVGAQVQPGVRPLLTIARRDAIRVQVAVIERDAHYVRNGLPVELVVYGVPGRTFLGKVTRFGRTIDPRTGTLRVEVEIRNPDGVLRPGMFGRVSLVVDRRPRTVVVPATAVLASDRGAWVYVVREQRARRVAVKLGHDLGAEVQVLQGLTGDENLVVAGRDLIRDGSPVRVWGQNATP